MEYSYFADISSPFFIIYLVGLMAGTMFSTFLDWLNSEKRGLRKKLGFLHRFGDDVKKLFPMSKVMKSLKYKRETDSFSDMNDTVVSGVSTLSVIFGILPFLIASVSATLPSVPILWCWIISLILVLLVSEVLSVPFEMYSTFGIEKRYGFSTTTRKTFFLDKAKGLLVASIGVVVVQNILDLALRTFCRMDFLGVVLFIATMFAFMSVLKWLFLNFIMPLFNKFEPLEDRNLEKRLLELCERCGLRNARIEVMDASRRSRHSNAFIISQWRKKRIVLFDTMLKSMTKDEIVAVVAHEIGHGKLHHFLLRGIVGTVSMAVFTTVAFILVQMPSFYAAFGYSWVNLENVMDNLAVGFSLVSMFMASVTWISVPFSSWASRKMEYAADRYSVEKTGDGRSLSTALLKLTSENLADIFPHPLYEFVNYSHPSILKRVGRIESLGKNL